MTNGYAANACEAFAANLVGDGIKPSSLIGNGDLRDRVQRLWPAWTDEADADGLTDFYGLQAMVAREMFVAGECFVRLRPRRAEDGLLGAAAAAAPAVRDAALREDRDGGQRQPHPLRDQVRRHRPARGLSLPPQPSGDSTDRRVAVPETVRVPAGDVLHIYRPRDAGQFAACRMWRPPWCGCSCSISTTTPSLTGRRPRRCSRASSPRRRRNSHDGHGEFEADGAAIASLEPGTLQVLLPGEDVSSRAPRMSAAAMRRSNTGRCSVSRPRSGCPITWSPAMCAKPTIRACARSSWSSAGGCSSSSTG